MNSLTIEILGYIAASLTTFAMLPQARIIYQSGNVENLSVVTFGMSTFGTILWLVYGIYKGDMVIISANVIATNIVGYIFYKKLMSLKK